MQNTLERQSYTSELENNMFLQSEHSPGPIISSNCELAQLLVNTDRARIYGQLINSKPMKKTLLMLPWA